MCFFEEQTLNNTEIWNNGALKMRFLKCTEILEDILKSNTSAFSLKVGIFWQLCDYFHLQDTVAASYHENTLVFINTKCMGMFYLLWITCLRNCF